MHSRNIGSRAAAGFIAGVLLMTTTHIWGVPPMDQEKLASLGTRYAAAWSGKDPAMFAAFYAQDGILGVNAGSPSVGRAAIAATAQSYMTAFPDMVVKMTRMEERDGQPMFHWSWTGTNTGPGGTGKFVRITGYEEWAIDASGHFAESKGHFDEAEYRRQLKDGAPPLP